MNGLLEAACEVDRFMRERKWRYCIIGGLAVVRWGKVRATQDVDISLFVELGRESEYVDELLGTFDARITDARQFALDNRVLLLISSNGTALDVALASFPFEEQCIDRATDGEFLPDVSVRTCSAEDLVVTKSFAARDRDRDDVEGILTRQSGKLDWPYIVQQLQSLCELTGNHDPVTWLEQTWARLDT